MVREMIKNRKYKDFYSFEEPECKIALILTIVIIVIGNCIKLFENFNAFRLALQNISIYVASGLLAMIGVILTGIALMLGLLDKKFRNSIKDVKGDPIKEIMLSFEFITINIGLASIVFFCIHLGLFIPFNIPKYTCYKIIFYSISFLIIYYFIFIVFYIIALISNSIDLFFIKGMYESVEIKDKSLYDYANEIRIDYLLGKFIKQENQNVLQKFTDKNNINSNEDIIRELDYIIDKTEGINIEKKCLIKNYFRQYYS
ncbi:hypothetical protein [Clostridium sp. AWRP]|uniref:hypothetical protein n=1 Tax=Clostridium sp. AWRP TaxID=2212991 RepID=UPI000FDB88CB|nr:hypothetical protein [Clostridium sp. AWRP]AZV56037.1 hypothetical protein DMR38_05160 [Clostridium sp. AWRP]